MTGRARRGRWGLAAGLCAVLVGAPVWAAPPPAGDGAQARPATRPSAALRPTVLVANGGGDDRVAREIAKRIDGALAEALADLGLRVEVETATPSGEPHQLADLARERQALVIAPVLRQRGGALELEIVAAEADSKVVTSRVETTEPGDAAVRAVVMVRDLVRHHLATVAGRSTGSPVPIAVPPEPLAAEARSEGRLTLAVNATLYGGLVGYSIQRASGSDDPRLLYPLMAVGAGVGLGGSLIVAGEWDVGVGDAWFLSAGAWWPTLSGIFIYEGRFAQLKSEEEADESRWTYGLIGGTAGITLSTLALTLGKMSEGGAVLAHSGGGLGTVYGALGEMAIEGSIDFFPQAGMGYGAAFGWLVASTVAVHVRPPPSRVLAMDLGAALGGLGGAALASPLLFDEPTPNQQRAWLAAAAGASVLGGGIALWWTASDDANRLAPPPVAASSASERPVGIQTVAPTLGVPEVSPPPELTREPWNAPNPHSPRYGAGLTGVWW